MSLGPAPAWRTRDSLCAVVRQRRGRTVLDMPALVHSFTPAWRSRDSLCAVVRPRLGSAVCDFCDALKGLIFRHVDLTSRR